MIGRARTEKLALVYASIVILCVDAFTADSHSHSRPGANPVATATSTCPVAQQDSVTDRPVDAVELSIMHSGRNLMVLHISRI